MDKCDVVYIVEFYSAIKRELMPVTWMDLEMVTPSEAKPVKTNTLCIHSSQGSAVFLNL